MLKEFKQVNEQFEIFLSFSSIIRASMRNLPSKAVLFLTKNLQAAPHLLSKPAIAIDTWQNPGDSRAWLALRNQVFATRSAKARDWDLNDFEREFTRKETWNPNWMWLAKTAGRETIGAVALTPAVESPTTGRVQWLMVAPSWRRRGIARALMAQLEHAAWQEGLRDLSLETLASWTEAVALYTALGYRPSLRKSSGGI